MIKKEFKNLNVRLVLEDCVEFLQNLESSSVDLILIDPLIKFLEKLILNREILKEMIGIDLEFLWNSENGIITLIS